MPIQPGYFKILSILLGFSQRVLLTGGGGYNPWTVARLWTGFWALMSGRTVPEVLPSQATEFLQSLSWQRRIKPKEIMFTSIYDVPLEGRLRDEVSNLVREVSSLHIFKYN